MAMRRGGYDTDASLASALTAFLKQKNLLDHPDKEVPYQTVQSARTRTKNSAYTIHIAWLCGVDPFWLAFREGTMLPSKSTGHRSERELVLLQSFREADAHLKRATEKLLDSPYQEPPHAVKPKRIAPKKNRRVSGGSE